MKKKNLWLKTERTNIYHPDITDLKNFCLLLTNTEVMKYTLKSKREDEISGELKRLIEHYNNFGFSAGSIHLKDTNKFIGRAGLFYPKNNEKATPCLACLLMPDSWKQGYGTEVLTSIISYSFDKLNCSEIFGLVHEKNMPSNKLVNKFNPIIEEVIYNNGEPFYKYIFKKT